MEKTYHEKVKIENELKLREMTKELPRFCQEFFLGTEHSTSSRTRLAYAYDLGIFFSFLQENNPICQKYAKRRIFELFESVYKGWRGAYK